MEFVSQSRHQTVRPQTAGPSASYPSPGAGVGGGASPSGQAGGWPSSAGQAGWPQAAAHEWPAPGDAAPSASRGAPQRQSLPERPSSAPMRTTGNARLRREPPGGTSATAPLSRRSTRVHVEQRAERAYGRVSLYDHDTKERAVHQYMGAVVLRDLSPPKHGLPPRQPEDFLKSGTGLGLEARIRLKEFLAQHPVNRDPPFKKGNGGVVLSFESGMPRPPTLFKTYYDNGTIDFLSVRWRGSRQDGLVWGRAVTRGSNTAAPKTYRTWCEEPSEVDVATWLPIFVEGILEQREPYQFMAVRGSEEMLFMAGERLHELAPSLVLPLKQLLDTRHPPTVGVALQLMANALRLDPRCAEEWIVHLWQFAQVFNLFLSKPRLAVDMGYASHSARHLRTLVTEILHALEEHGGGEAATATVRRYCRAHDPAVTARSQARAAAKLANKVEEAAAAAGVSVEEAAGFKPFTLF